MCTIILVQSSRVCVAHGENPNDGSTTSSIQCGQILLTYLHDLHYKGRMEEQEMKRMRKAEMDMKNGNDLYQINAISFI